jgi:hypothetical protein
MLVGATGAELAGIIGTIGAVDVVQDEVDAGATGTGLMQELHAVIVVVTSG